MLTDVEEILRQCRLRAHALSVHLNDRCAPMIVLYTLLRWENCSANVLVRELVDDEFELLRDVTQLFNATISTIPKWSVADFVVDAVGRHIPIVSSLGWNIVMDEAMKQDAEFRLGAVRSEYLLLAVMDLLPAFSNILRLHGVERERILAYLRNEYEERSRFRDIG